ncbi:hypothetical protein ACVLV4_000382 [Rathayibacter agropyri]
MAAVVLLGIWLAEVANLPGGAGRGNLLVLGGPVIVVALISLTANAHLIFSTRAGRAEVSTVLARAPGYRRIMAMWILAPLS